MKRNEGEIIEKDKYEGDWGGEGGHWKKEGAAMRERENNWMRQREGGGKKSGQMRESEWEG